MCDAMPRLSSTTVAQRELLLVRSRLFRSFFLQHSSHGGQSDRHVETRASDRLFADAAAEEEEAAATVDSDTPPHNNSGRLRPVDEHPNWTGEESVQDAVLRMLVDKYRPLRGASMRGAEEKLRAAPPAVAAQTVGTSPSAAAPASAQPDAARSGPHKPWHTTFRAPSESPIRRMRLPPPPVPAASRAHSPQRPPADDARARAGERERRTKAAAAAHAVRLTDARESSEDYRLGKTPRAPREAHYLSSHSRPTNPTSLKGWASLVEERIERARSEGYFRDVKGRGKPLVRENEERNPFIPREEFLMNRIVQRQGAAPPWVEIQRELESAVNSFRATLRSSWTRRAVRMLTLEGQPRRVLQADVAGPRVRDAEWEAREAAYHRAAIEDVNALVRKYNVVAPYAARRTLLSREAELRRAYEASGPDIWAELERRRDEAATTSGGEGCGVLGETAREGHREQRRDTNTLWNRLIARLFGG